MTSTREWWNASSTWNNQPHVNTGFNVFKYAPGPFTTLGALDTKHNVSMTWIIVVWSWCSLRSTSLMWTQWDLRFAARVWHYDSGLGKVSADGDGNTCGISLATPFEALIYWSEESEIAQCPGEFWVRNDILKYSDFCVTSFQPSISTHHSNNLSNDTSNNWHNEELFSLNPSKIRNSVVRAALDALFVEKSNYTQSKLDKMGHPYQDEVIVLDQKSLSQIRTLAPSGHGGPPIKRSASMQIIRACVTKVVHDFTRC